VSESETLLLLGGCDAAGVPDDGTAALFAAAGRLGRRTDPRLCVALIPEPGASRDLVARAPRGARSFLVRTPRESASQAALAAASAELARRLDARCVLLPDDHRSRELAARLAASLRVPCATGCRDISLSGGELRFRRDLYGGSVFGEFVARADGLVATVTSASPEAAPAELETVVPEPIEAGAATSPTAPRLLDRAPSDDSEVSLERAARIVAGGRGIGGAEGFRRLADLGRRIGAQLAASRPPCDAGWIPASRLVGITGCSVKPDFYLAVGISGSAQHRSGMSESGTVVAINSDDSADIFRYADYGVVGDWEEVIAGMTEALGAPGAARLERTP
jgi:electron transfer flavoprotein alpha subunit